MKGFNSLFSQSSLVPLAKIANAPSRSLRLLWAVFTATMFVGLCSCITLVVIQYCRHQTVFQLDYSGRNVLYDQIPGFTICPQIQEAKRLFNEAMDVEPIKSPLSWLDKTLLDKFRSRARLLKPNLTTGAIVHRLPPGQLYWDTNTVALSPLYGLLQNFSVRFYMQPSRMEISHRMTVMEQVPNLKHFLCTTFELHAHHPAASSWSYLEIELNQFTSIKSPQFTAFTLIVHERGELPFSAYERHIQTSLTPTTEVSLYISKSVTARLNTARNPCFDFPSVKQPLTTALEFEEDGYDFDQNIHTSRWNTSKIIPYTWELDYLDKLRMEMENQDLSGKKRTLNGQFVMEAGTDDHNLRSHRQPTVKLFGTHFFYSREACGWAECSRKVQRVCNCSSSIELWSYKMNGCENVTACERNECQVKKISYDTCPLSCVLTKFVKHNTITETGNEANLEPGSIRVKLVRSEAVQVATEEEIFSLAKLFSEVGGLCSLFIGFSCIFLFELVEAAILMRRDTRRVNEAVEDLMTENCGATSVGLLQRTSTNVFVDRCPATKENGTVIRMRTGCEQNDRATNNRPKNQKEESEKPPITKMANLSSINQSVRKPTWINGMLVVPLYLSSPGILLACTECEDGSQNNTANISHNEEKEQSCTKQELLQLLRQNKVRFQLLWSQ